MGSGCCCYVPTTSGVPLLLLTKIQSHCLLPIPGTWQVLPCSGLSLVPRLAGTLILSVTLLSVTLQKGLPWWFYLCHSICVFLFSYLFICWFVISLPRLDLKLHDKTFSDSPVCSEPLIAFLVHTRNISDICGIIKGTPGKRSRRKRPGHRYQRQGICAWLRVDCSFWEKECQLKVTGPLRPLAVSEVIITQVILVMCIN